MTQYAIYQTTGIKNTETMKVYPLQKSDDVMPGGPWGAPMGHEGDPLYGGYYYVVTKNNRYCATFTDRANAFAFIGVQDRPAETLPAEEVHPDMVLPLLDPTMTS